MEEHTTANMFNQVRARKAIRFFRYEFHALGDVMPSAPVGFQIVDARPWIRRAQPIEQVGREVDQEERETHRVLDRDLFYPHEILQAKVVLGISKGKLDLEAQLVIVEELLRLQRKVAAEQHHVPHALGLQVRLYHDDDVDRVGKELMQTARLLHRGAITVLGGIRTPQRFRQVSVVDPGSVLEPRALGLLLGRGQQGELGVVVHLGNQVQIHPPHHRASTGIAEMTVQDQGDDPDMVLYACQNPLSLRQNPLQFRPKDELGFVFILAAVGRAAWPLGTPFLSARLAQRLTLLGLLLFLRRANDLLGRQGVGLSFGNVDERDREETQTSPDLGVDGREEPINTMRLLACFADGTLICGQEAFHSLLLKEEEIEMPLDCRPINRSMKEAMDAAIAASFVGPARNTPLGDAASHR
jgi:hypothetical protein